MSVGSSNRNAFCRLIFSNFVSRAIVSESESERERERERKKERERELCPSRVTNSCDPYARLTLVFIFIYSCKSNSQALKLKMAKRLFIEVCHWVLATSFVWSHKFIFKTDGDPKVRNHHRRHNHHYHHHYRNRIMIIITRLPVNLFRKEQEIALFPQVIAFEVFKSFSQIKISLRSTVFTSLHLHTCIHTYTHTHTYIVDCRGVIVIDVGIGHGDSSSIPDRAVWISPSANTPGKGINPTTGKC